jgi:hypothetical protein
LARLQDINCIRFSEYTSAKTLSRAAPAGLPHRRRAFHVSLDFWDIMEATLQAFHQVSLECGSRGRKPVEVPETVLFCFHQPGPAQVSQMPRRGRLGHAQDPNQIAHAHLTA